MLGCYYVLIIEGDVEPRLSSHYHNPKDRDNEALRLKREYGDKHGIFALDLDTAGRPDIWAYSNSFFETGEYPNEDEDE